MLKGSEKAWEGARYAAENAADLQHAARALAESGKFGLATSLAILSAEEFSKSVALIFESAGLEKTAHPIKEYFRNHKVKHEAGIIYAILAQLGKYFGALVADIERENPGRREKWPELIMERTKKDMEIYMQGRADPFAEMRAWSESADQAKQNGLYVGFRENRWSKPSDTLKSEYEERMAVTESLAFLVGKAFEYLSHADVRRAYQEHILTRDNG